MQRNQTVRALLCATAVAAVLGVVTGCNKPTPGPQNPPPLVPAAAEPKSFATNLVRGYLAVAVGRSPKAEASGGIYARELEGKDIYLPGVEVYLEDRKNNKRSEPVATDLSGRFSLQAPSAADFHLCWKSTVYGDGCLKDSFKAGTEPLFLSTVLVGVPQKQGFVASFGKVRFKDDTLPRTLEPLSNINAYATVTLVDKNNAEVATVPVNNFGDYLLPYLPNKESVQLVSRIEGAKGEQLVQPEAYTRNPRVVRYHLTINNTAPQLDGVVPRNGAGRRVQLASPGDKVELKAFAKDRDGDALKVQWVLLDGSGTVSAASGNATTWTLPTTVGRYAVMAIVSDGKGGYARHTVRLNAGAPGVAFGGVVVGTDGKLLDGAEVDINGKLEKTNTEGRFLTYVPDADAYVMNIRKPGYGFYSRVYDRTVAGGRWTLATATVADFDPTQDFSLQDKRAGRNCPGPDTARVNWNERANLKQVWWQDGKGNNVPPPAWFKDGGANDAGNAPGTVASGANPDVNPDIKGERKGKEDRKGRNVVLLPWQKTKHGECGPGLAVKIPANAVQTETGAAPVGQVEISLSTVDLNTPEQMPGEDAVVRPGGGFGWMQSYGAGSVELREKSTGKRLQLKPGFEADVSIPVDRSQLAPGGSLPAAVPLLYYNEKKGTWDEAHQLNLDAAKKNYVTKVKHFSTLNTDVVFIDPACLRVESTIATPYDLEVRIPLPGGAAPRLKKVTITDAPPHVIYSLPVDTNITLTAMSPGAGSTPPRVLGVFVVNTGAKQAPGFTPPPPPTACSTTVTLSTQTFPDVPVNGEFLHGLFSFAGTVISEVDIANVGTLSQQLDQATLNYYAQIDPPSAGNPNGERFTLDAFKAKNGFNVARPPGFQLCAGNVCDDPDQEVNVVFANSGDLGFGRDMHCRRTNTGGATGFDYACYVSNYGDIITDDTLDATNASINNGLIATVAMEFSRILPTEALTERHVKFYVYGAGGTRINNADLDTGLNLRRRPVPQLCMVCHGGAYPGGGSTGVPLFNTPDSVKLGSKFIPFDTRFYTFPASPNKAQQQVAMKRLNEDIVKFAPGTTAINEVIDAMYTGGATTQREEFTVPGWEKTQLPNTAAQVDFYKRVMGNACRACHIAQPFTNMSNERAGVDLQFRTARDFLRSQVVTSGGTFSPFSSAEQRVCADHVMPHAKRTHDIFWGQYWANDFGAISPTIAGEFQAFGDTIKLAPRPAGWPAAEAWPPVWNGELCGDFTPGASSTPPSYYSTYVHPLWSRNYTTRTCTTCHSGLSGNAAATHAELLNANGLNGTLGLVDVVPNNVAGSNVVNKLEGTAAFARMPLGCPSADNRCLNDGAGYNPATDLTPGSTTHEMNRIKNWINTGAVP